MVNANLHLTGRSFNARSLWGCGGAHACGTLGVTNIYFWMFHKLSLRWSLSPLLQMRKMRLREVKVGKSRVCWTLSRSGAWCSWSSNPATPCPRVPAVDPHHVSKCCVTIRIFLLWRQPLLKKGKRRSTKFLHKAREGEDLSVTKCQFLCH